MAAFDKRGFIKALREANYKVKATVHADGEIEFRHDTLHSLRDEIFALRDTFYITDKKKAALEAAEAEVARKQQVLADEGALVEAVGILIDLCKALDKANVVKLPKAKRDLIAKIEQALGI